MAIGTAVINVAYVNLPKAGKKNGSVKTADGAYYGVPPNMLALFQPNNSYEVAYETSEWQGKTYRNVSAVKPAGSTPPVMHHPAAGRNAGPQDMATAERIFVCGALNAAIRAGQVNVGDVESTTHAVQAIREAWRMTLGNPQQRDDMDDSIPF